MRTIAGIAGTPEAARTWSKLRTLSCFSGALFSFSKTARCFGDSRQHSEAGSLPNLGPSLQANGAPLPGSLQNPFLELHDGNGALLRDNDDWRDAPNTAEIQATTLAPPDDRESVVLMTLTAGNYTSIVRGVNRTTGIAVSEAFKLDN